jgi:hypothetical protein
MKEFVVSMILVASLLSGHAYAQEKPDSLPAGYHKNVIKWNLTPFILWSKKNINFSYERVLKPHRTFSVNAGYFVLPTAGNFEMVNIHRSNNNSGFSVSADYRFYFKKRNPDFAPDGLYWGVFASSHFYQFKNEVFIPDNPAIEGSLGLDGKLNILSLGAELGYQFIIKEKFSIDLIFLGPSLSAYSTKLQLDGDITIDQENEYIEAIRDALISRLPFLDGLIDSKNFKSKGFTHNVGPGMRYVVQLGYRF